MFLFSQHIPDGWYYCQGGPGLTGKLTTTDNAITYQNNIMLFVCHPKILHKHCLQFLLGVKMAPRETEKKTSTIKMDNWETVRFPVVWDFPNIRIPA